MTRRRPRRGFKLVDMMVAIFVTALLIFMFMPAVRDHDGGRRAQCANNMRQLGLALVCYSAAKNVFPGAGTFFDDPAIHQGDPTRSSIYTAMTNPAAFAAGSNPCRYSWVVPILPFLDDQELYNAWIFSEPYDSTLSKNPASPSNATITRTAIGTLKCPDDRTAVPGQGNLSYAVNGGFARWGAIPLSWDGDVKANGSPGNGPELRWSPDGSWRSTQSVVHKLGVMSLNTHTGDQPWDAHTSPSAIADGAFSTILLGENVLTGYSPGTGYSGGRPTNWACPLPNFAMFLASDDVCQSPGSPTDCLAGQLRPAAIGVTGAGWSRANRQGGGEGINDTRGRTVEGSFPFLNSGHPGGANIVFCDGSVRFLGSSIDGGVYARLITPAGGKLPTDLRQAPMSTSDLDW